MPYDHSSDVYQDFSREDIAALCEAFANKNPDGKTTTTSHIAPDEIDEHHNKLKTSRLDDKGRRALEKWNDATKRLKKIYNSKSNSSDSESELIQKNILHDLSAAILLDEKGCTLEKGYGNTSSNMMRKLAQDLIKTSPLEANVMLGYLSMNDQNHVESGKYFEKAYKIKKALIVAQTSTTQSLNQHQNSRTSDSSSSSNLNSDASNSSSPNHTALPLSRICCMIATTFALRQSFAQSLKYLNEASDNTTDDEENCFYLQLKGSCLRQLGREKEALVAMRKYVQLATENAKRSPFGSKKREHLCETAYGLAQLEMYQNNNKEFREAYQLAEELYSTLDDRSKQECSMNKMVLEMEMKMKGITIDNNAHTKSSTFSPGEIVEILPGRKYAGERGTVASENHQKKAAIGRTIVELKPVNLDTNTTGKDNSNDNMIQVAFKNEALKLVKRNKSTTETEKRKFDEDAQHVLECGPLFKGDTVIIDGLVKRPELNGRVGVIQAELSAESGRYVVEIAPVVNNNGKSSESSSASNILESSPAPEFLKLLPKNLLRKGIPDTECAICLGELRNPTKLACNHSFCGICVADAVNHSFSLNESKCPLCRQTISIRDLQTISKFAAARRDETPVHFLNHLLDPSGPLDPNAANAAYQLDYNKLRERQRKIFRAAHQGRGTAWKVDHFEKQRILFGLDTVGLEVDGSDDPVIMSTCDVILNKRDKYGDGDQSMLIFDKPGCPCFALEYYWTGGGTLQILSSGCTVYSNVFKASAWGNYKELKALLDSFDESEKSSTTENLDKVITNIDNDLNSNEKSNTSCTVDSDNTDNLSGKNNSNINSKKIQAIEERFSSVRFNSLLACIYGNKLMKSVNGLPRSCMILKQYGYDLDPDRDIDHVKCASLLLQHGANPRVKDIIGCSALAHALGINATDETLEISKLLLKHGADPLVVDRRGGSVLGDLAKSDDVASLKKAMNILGGTDKNIIRNMKGKYHYSSSNSLSTMIGQNHDTGSREVQVKEISLLDDVNIPYDTRRVIREFLESKGN